MDCTFEFTDEIESIAPAELAKVWHISTKTVYRLVESGKLQCMRIGRTIRFTRQQVSAFMEANSV